MKYANLFFRGLEANWRTLMEYKESFYTAVIAGLFEVLMTVLFWSIIFTKITTLNGWGLGQIIMISGFLHLFYGFTDFFFDGVWAIENIIVYGKIDRYLPRPVEPLFIEIVTRMDFFAIKHFINFAVFLCIACTLGVPISVKVIIGAVLCFFASIIFGLIGLCVQLLTFWIGKSNAMYGLFSIIWNFGDYPMTIFPVIIQQIFVLVFPIFVAAAIPAMIMSDMLSAAQVFQYVVISLALIAFWSVVACVLWKRGLKRYDSYGG